MYPSGSPASTQISHEDRLAFFRRVPLLRGLDDAALDMLAEKSLPYRHRAGSMIFRMGDASHRIYFVFSGRVAEYVCYGASEHIIVKLRKQFDYIGEMGALLEQPYPNIAMAHTEVLLLGVPKQVFLSVSHRFPSILMYIIRELTDRLIASSQKMVSYMNLDAEGKLAFTLLKLIGGAEGDAAGINITQAVLASATGIVRQTVARILGDWRKQGWISTLRGQIVVEDMNALLDIISASELR